MKSVLLILSLLALVAVTFAHPIKWKVCPAGARNNYGHPTTGRGNHAGVAVDKRITFAVKYGGKLTGAYCPGKAHDITVTFPLPRKYIVTASAGNFVGGVVTCTGLRVTQNLKAKTYVGKLVVPAKSTGTLVVKVTSSLCSTCPYLQNTITLKKATRC